jgi:hypothetical protein
VSGFDKGREFEAGTPLNAHQLKEILLKSSPATPPGAGAGRS